MIGNLDWKLDEKISPIGKFKNEGYHDDPYLRSLITKHERIATRIFQSSTEGSKAVAGEVAGLIRQKSANKEKCVLGLAAGSAPSEVYSELIRMHNEESLSFKNVLVFVVVEYYPIKPDAIQSFGRALREKFLNHIDIPSENIHLLDGMVEPEKVYEFCRNIELKIERLGGIDIQILGIGPTGHIALNEPGSSLNSLTRLVSLDDITRVHASSDFFGKENVPRKAITLGIKTIMKSKKIRLLAWGEGKAPIVKRSVEGKFTEEVPVSLLQNHQDAKVILDVAAAAKLTRIETPWLIDSVVWDDKLVRKAVVWLCQKAKKPILKLTDRDYNDNGMGELLAERGNAYQINIRVFNELQHTITGWPGGKPNADDTHRPERKEPFPKRVLIFSPHPDDDVISMGGTMIRLVDHGHDVHLAYQVSGSLAVSDSDVLRYLDFVHDYSELVEGEDTTTLEEEHNRLREFIKNKKHDTIDLPEVRTIKGLIRVGEAKAACRYANVKSKNVHFLMLPFYETGGVEKKPLGDEDIQIVKELIREVKPHQIYAAGDLTDPHGTHRICLDAVQKALKQMKGETWIEDCYFWMYRGAWQEWEIHEVDMAVPLSPDEVTVKRKAIFKHQSQKDNVPFPGSDKREFWQRAEERNHNTAVMYDRLGLAEYQAMEVFARLIF